MTVAPARVRPPDRPLPGLLRARFGWWSSGRRRRRDLQRPAQVLRRLGCSRLPGTGADTELYEALDAYDRPFGLVVVPGTGHTSVTLALRPPRPDLLTPDGAASWVDALGAWLAPTAAGPTFAGCTVGVLHPGSPDVAAGGVAPAVTLQLTWLARGPQGRTDPAALAAELGGRLPHLVNDLRRRGVGTARPLAAAERVRAVATAYDPDGGGAARAWPEAAPRLAVEAWDRLRHDSATSLTWCLREVPADRVLSGVLAELAAAPDGVLAARSRVALLYRPAAPPGGHRIEPAAPDDDWTGLPPGVLAPPPPLAGPPAAPPPGPPPGSRAPAAAGPDLTALVAVSVTGRPDDRDALLDDAVRGVLDGVAPTLRPWLRPLYGSAAAAFAATVPGGTLLDVHSLPAAAVREAGA